MNASSSQLIASVNTAATCNAAIAPNSAATAHIARFEEPAFTANDSTQGPLPLASGATCYGAKSTRAPRHRFFSRPREQRIRNVCSRHEAGSCQGFTCPGWEQRVSWEGDWEDDG